MNVIRQISRLRFNNIICSRSCPRSSIAYSISREKESISLKIRNLSTTSSITSNGPIKVDQSLNNLIIEWPNIKTRYSYIWLRDNCQCSECLHPDNKQRLHSSADVPLDIKPLSVTTTDNGITIVWDKLLRKQSDDELFHQSTYEFSFLKHYSSRNATISKRRNDLTQVVWDGALMKEKNIWVDCHEYMNSDKTLLAVLKQLWSYGLAFLYNVPTRDQEIVKIVTRIGSLKNTFYGPTWDVKSVPGAKNIAYTNLELGLHMDLLYTEAPPGLQFLHCLQNTVTGGQSIFADSLAAVYNLRQRHPQAYQLLKQTPLTFHYVNDGHHVHFNRPAIVEDLHNNTLTLHRRP
ncbi:8869_t:CDS:2 [Paraglomus occultum]|uniref:8869_t:CDS:1 n=1 Tax=Paraglomus occultum TaxID=144539 RepID=A0A9N9FMY7_9GLOM|nr:8869_t:CDS:2 [Paraglomus occultum]